MKILDVYNLFPIPIDRGSGSWLYTKDGDRYLDLYGGHAVISVGHGHPIYTEKLKKQLDKITFYSNSVMIEGQHELAFKLGKLSGYSGYNLFLSNSGSEANENAFKVASFTTGRKKILAVKNSFHGRTSGAVEATDDSMIISHFNTNGNVTFIPLNDSLALAAALNRREYAAFIIEGIQGVAGINVPDEQFMKTAEELCKSTGTVFIVDEVQSGYGRTGSFFAHQHCNVKPDIITIAKGMGNGFPVAGTIIRPDISVRKGQLGTTFGGNHLACAAAIAVLDIIESENLIKRASKVGDNFISELKKINGIKSVKGRGLMIGIELSEDVTTSRNTLLEQHRIFTGNSSDKNVLRVLPALNVNESHLKYFTESLTVVLENTLEEA